MPCFRPNQGPMRPLIATHSWPKKYPCLKGPRNQMLFLVPKYVNIKQMGNTRHNGTYLKAWVLSRKTRGLISISSQNKLAVAVHESSAITTPI